LIPGWLSISAGELFELTRPAAFVLSALASTWVLASARRQSFALYAVAAWALATLYVPLVTLPIYLIVRAARRRATAVTTETAEPPEEKTKTTTATTPSVEPDAEELASEHAKPDGQPQPRLRYALPLLYLLAVLSLGSLLYYQDARSIDAHLARANHARLLGQRDKTIKEYRAALRLEENAHTRNLLGIELAAAGQLSAALDEFRAAERAGEADDDLSYRIAATLDALDRPAEALPGYQKFLSTRRCTTAYPDPQCAVARARVNSKP
jgi:tetratricopeptide (TPR) repeat protein